MKFCAIQLPYAHDYKQAEKSVDFLLAELAKCDESCDLILTPEYSNAPAAFPAGEAIPFAKAQAPRLLEAARATAIRCHAIVALSGLLEVAPGVFRNTTRLFDREGNVAGDLSNSIFRGRNSGASTRITGTRRNIILRRSLNWKGSVLRP